MVQSQGRLLPAAAEIVHGISGIQDINSAMKSPIMAFSASMAALILLEDFEADPNSRSEEHIVYLLQVLATAGKTNAVARSLAHQLVGRMSAMGVHTELEDQVNMPN